MAKPNYQRRFKSSRVASLMSNTCSWCYGSGDPGTANGIRNAFFGVPITVAMLGNRPQDHEFQKNVWQAAQKHLREVHGRKIVSNGVGGWKVVKA